MPQMLSQGLQRKSGVGASKCLIYYSVSVLLIQSNQINIKYMLLYFKTQHQPKNKEIYSRKIIVSKVIQNQIRLFRWHNRTHLFFYFQHIKQMRREILSKARKDSMRILREPSLRVIQPAEIEVPQAKTQKRLNLHMRSRTRNFQQQICKDYGNHYQTPGIFLPRIVQNSERVRQEAQKSSLDGLQEHLHRMLLKNLKKCRQNKNIKSLQDEIDKKKLDNKERQQQYKKKSQKTRLQQLRLKLQQLYGDLATEENKLKIQYSLEEKMQKKYNEFYDKMTRRFQKNTTVDASQNTQEPPVIRKSSTKQYKKSKYISKFRAAVYAVYFTILFPKYSKNFRLIRKKHFIQIAVHKKSIQTSIQTCHRLFEMMRLKPFWKQIQDKNKDLTQETIFSDAQFQGKPISYDFKIENVYSLLQFVLSSILTAVKSGKIDDFIKIIAQSLTNRSYITDRLFLESELYEINVNQQMMNLSPQQQKILLVNFVLIKLVAFSFMMNNSFLSDGKSQYIFNKQNSNKFENLTLTISKQLLLSGIYLIKLCNNLNMHSKISKQLLQGNMESRTIEKLSLPMPQIEFKTKLAFAKKEANKRVSIQEGIEAFNAEGQGIYVKNMKKLSDYISVLEDQTNKNELFQATIIQIRDEIYKKMIQLKSQSYQQLKNATFQYFNEKSQNGAELSLLSLDRSQQQRAEIQRYCKYFESKRSKIKQKPKETIQQKQQPIKQFTNDSNPDIQIKSD